MKGIPCASRPIRTVSRMPPTSTRPSTIGFRVAAKARCITSSEGAWLTLPTATARPLTKLTATTERLANKSLRSLPPTPPPWSGDLSWAAPR